MLLSFQNLYKTSARCSLPLGHTERGRLMNPAIGGAAVFPGGAVELFPHTAKDSL